LNILAHIFLSGNTPEIILGNFIGDFVKGNLDSQKIKALYSTGIINGLSLHREIDFYTDNHPVVRKSIDRIQKKYHKFSGIVIDVIYDHYLSKDFDKYSNTHLPIFAENFYRFIESYKDALPEEVKRMMGYMISQDWLNNYATYEGIDRTLNGISRRTTFTSGIAEAAIELVNLKDEFQADFDEYFPQLQQKCKEFLSTI
jgi:acyl carrier protein phosphodiesterase